MQSVRRISCEGRSPSSIHREAQEAVLHGKSVSLNFVVSHDTLRSLESVISEQKSFGSSIVALNLSDSKLNVDNLSAISTMFAKSPLQTLVLERCGIDDRAAPKLAEFMSQCPKLCTVNVRNNALSDAGAKLLHKSAVGHPCLQSVVCDGCPISVRRQKQLFDIPKKAMVGASALPVFTPPAPTPHSTPHLARTMNHPSAIARTVDERRVATATLDSRDTNSMTHAPSSSIAESTRLEWNILTLKQPPSSKKVGRSSSVPRGQTTSSSAAIRRPSYTNTRTITQEVVDSMFSPTPRNVDNRIFARNLKFKTARSLERPSAYDGSHGTATNSSNLTPAHDFGDLLKNQQLSMLQSHCQSLEAELAEQQQILKVQQERCSAAESQCLQLQHSRLQQAELISVMRKDLHRALNTVQAVSARCSQLISDRNLFREQKRSLEQLIGSFVSGVTSVGSKAPQHLHDAFESFAIGHQQTSAQENDAIEDGNKELMELLQSIWGNNDSNSVALGDQPTPAIAKVARDFQVASNTPGKDLQKDLLPQFMSHFKSASSGNDGSHAEVDKFVSQSDSDFDEINRFLQTRVSSIMEHHDHTGQQTSPKEHNSHGNSGESSSTQGANHVPIRPAATGSASLNEMKAADVKTYGGDQFSSPPKQTTTSTTKAMKTSPISTAASASKRSAPAGNAGKQESSLRSYEDLQVQLHTQATTGQISASATSKLSVAGSQIEPGKDQVSAMAVTRAARSTPSHTSFLDPIHEPETNLHSMMVRPVQTEAKLQSSPRSSTDSLSSVLPTVSTPLQSEFAGSLVESHVASPTISSPKTYEELQIALQRGYSGFASAVTGITGDLMQQSPLPKQKTASAHIEDSKNGQTRNLLQNKAENRSQSSDKASSKSRSRQSMPNAETSKKSGSDSALNKTPPVSNETSFATVSTFNLPPSFFS